jgi:putative ABC transport system substrate-binding protein
MRYLEFINKETLVNHKQGLLFILVALLVAFSATACGPQKPKTFAVGYYTFAPVPEIVTDLVKGAMAELGYAEGENVTYVIRNAGADLGAIPQVAQELVDADVDVVIAVGGILAQSIMEITEDIPIVLVSSYPVEAGIVDDYRDHGRNLTGIATRQPVERQLGYLLEIVPDVERIFVPHAPELGLSEELKLEELTKAAADSGIEVVVGEANTDQKVAELLVDFPADIDAIFLYTNRITHFPGDDANLIPFAIEHRLPLAVASNTSVANGALVSYTNDLAALTRQAMRLVDKILSGTPPGSLPIEQPEYFMTVNLKTAQAIGVEIPEDVLEAAHTIIR